MKYTVTCILFIQFSLLFSQEDSLTVSDSLSDRKVAYYGHRILPPHYGVCWGSEEGVYLGIENRYEMGSYAVGIEGKLWVAMFGSFIYTASGYAGYRYLFDFQGVDNSLNHAFKIGGQFSFAGLETNIYFGKYDQFLWTITPKLGFDFGHLSLFYGYSLPIINQSDQSWNDFHMVQLVYSFNLIGGKPKLK